MTSNITAPITPAMMENTNPPLPAPPPIPRRLRSHPPRTAPTMPMMIVTIIPPGSSPGMTNFANAPAMSKTMIQNIKADITASEHSLVVRYYYVQNFIPLDSERNTPLQIGGRDMRDF